MKERREGSPQEVEPLRELHYGEEFPLFHNVDLPERVTQELIYTQQTGDDPLEFGDKYIHYFPNYPFSLDGIRGVVLLFGDSRWGGYKFELPLGEVRETVTKITREAEDQNNFTENRVSEVPLGFAVRLMVISQEDLVRIQKTRLELKMGENVYDLPLGNDINDLAVEYNREGDSGFLHTTFRNLSSDQYLGFKGNRRRDIVNRNNKNVQILLPYDSEALKTIRATFYDDVVPEHPLTEESL